MMPDESFALNLNEGDYRVGFLKIDRTEPH